jgi:hypothetical protein
VHPTVAARVHDVRVAVGTIQRIFRDLGLPRPRRTPKRAPRQMKLFEKAEPGMSFPFAFAQAVRALRIRPGF